jgi:hypothetical protein
LHSHARVLHTAYEYAGFIALIGSLYVVAGGVLIRVKGEATPAVNSVFPRLPPECIAPLRDWCFFWDWDTTRHEVRWMTSWDTTIEDVTTFAAGVEAIVVDGTRA